MVGSAGAIRASVCLSDGRSTSRQYRRPSGVGKTQSQNLLIQLLGSSLRSSGLGLAPIAPALLFLALLLLACLLKLLEQNAWGRASYLGSVMGCWLGFGMGKNSDERSSLLTVGRKKRLGVLGMGKRENTHTLTSKLLRLAVAGASKGLNTYFLDFYQKRSKLMRLLRGKEKTIPSS